MRETHQCAQRPNSWALLGDSTRCPACGARVQVWRPLRAAAGTAEAILLVLSIAFAIKLRTFLPYAAGIPACVLAEMAVMKRGRIVSVPEKSAARKRNEAIIAMGLVGALAAWLAWLQHGV